MLKETMTEKSDTENAFPKDSSSKLDLSTESNSKQVNDDSSEAKLLQLGRKSSNKYLLKTKSLQKKKHQAAQTTDWLRTHYCSCPTVCLPREIIYDHYIKFCKSQKMLPICKATFGKVIRHTFPTVSSKRLGARGQSRYHYNGIGIKLKGEHLHGITGSKHGFTRFSSSSYGKNCIRIFLTMYSIHCQCIVDAAISGHFEEVQSFLLHFWQGFPDHLNSIFMDPMTLDLIASCDSILYFTLTDILIPSEVMEIPEKLLKGIQSVAMNWEKWLECSLENMTFHLKQLKIEQGRRFSKNLKRNATFLHLSQVSRPLLNESVFKSLSEEVIQLKKERWFGINISSSRKMDVLHSILESRKFDCWIECMEHLIQDEINVRDNIPILIAI